MNEKHWDAVLNIKTEGFSKFAPTAHYFRYEATPYIVLEQLIKHLPIKKDDRFVDFGCGKGRTLFYIHYRLKIATVGVEMDAVLFRHLTANCERYFRKHQGDNHEIIRYHGFAEEYPIDSRETIFYFFHPFSAQIFRQVVNNILRSYLQKRREITLVLYYPSQDYIDLLERGTPFRLEDDIPVDPLFQNNENERLMIYRLSE